MKGTTQDIVVFKCPNCQKELKAKKGSCGKKGQCPQCRSIIRIPDKSV